MKNLILNIKYYLLFLTVVLASFYLYLNFGIDFSKNYSPEIIADTSFRDQIAVYEIQDEKIFTGKLSKKIKVDKNDTLIQILGSNAVSYTHLTLPTNDVV